MPYVFRRPMTKERQEDNPFAYNRDAVKTETRRILSQSEKKSAKEKRDRLLVIIEEFNQWSKNEYAAELGNLSDLYKKIQRAKELINRELADSANRDASSTLRSWQKELEDLSS